MCDVRFSRQLPGLLSLTAFGVAKASGSLSAVLAGWSLAAYYLQWYRMMA